MPKLLIKKGTERIREHTISSDIVAFTIGSEPGNDIVVNDPGVSMLHLQFEREGSSYYVRDLRSATGTFLNGGRVEHREKVEDGDVLDIGEHRILFKEHAANELQRQALSRVWPEEANGDQNGQPSAMDQMVEARQPSMGAVVGSAAESGSVQPSDAEPEERSDPFDLFFAIPESEDDEQVRETDQPRNGSSNYYLLAIHGPYLGKSYALKQGETRIGRDTALNDIVIRENERGEVDTSISRRHATISFRDGAYYLSDKRSKTRTYVNQRKIDPEAEVRLQPGDEIEIISDQKSTIFRFVPEGAWDYRSPRRAGVWWVRHRALSARAISVGVILACVFAFWQAWGYRQILAAKPDQLQLAESLWYVDAAPAAGQETDATSSEPVVGDLNGDGAADLILIDANGVVNVVSGADRAVLWSLPGIEANSAIPATLADLNNDGHEDVIVTSVDSRVRAIDGKLGVEIWTSPILAGFFSGSPVAADVNGDGIRDVVVTTTEGIIHTGLGTLTEPSWHQNSFGSLSHSVATAEDLSENGLPELLIGTETGKIMVYSGARNQVLGSIDVNAEIAKKWGVTGTMNPIRSPVVSGDFDGDGVIDFIVATDEGNILSMDGSSLQCLWGERLPRPTEPIWNAYAVRVGDLDADGVNDALISVKDGRLRAIKALPHGQERGKLLWEHQASPGTRWVGSPALVDLNKNGTADVVVATRDGSVQVLEGSTGSTVTEWTGNPQPIVSGPVVADMDGDTYLDILVRRSDDGYYQIRTNRRVPQGSVVWGQTAGGPQHTGRLAYVDPSSASSTWTLAGSSVIVIMTIILNVTAYRKRQILAGSH